MAGTGDAAATDGEWHESNNANNNNGDIREKSRNRVNVRGGRGGSDSRGWRGREGRDTENDRNASGPGDNKSNDKWQPAGVARRGPPGSFRNGGFSGGRGGRSGG